MGDLANMTSVHGDVNGFRLLRWLRNRAELEEQAGVNLPSRGQSFTGGWHAGRACLLTEMAEDLERELTPPEYYGDDDTFTFIGLGDSGPCDGCGRLTDRVEVQDNGRGWFACPDCKKHLGANAVDLDDPAFLGRPEQE